MPNHTHEWADEDIGMNCGRYSYREGERVEEYFPDTQKDRIEFASSVMDVSPQDYALFLNASEKEYICLPDDEYEVIEAAGVKALFTNERLTADNIPKGLYCYHLRESDNGDRFASIENIVKRHVKHKKRENPKKAVKKQNTPYKLRIYGVYEV